MGTYIFQMRSTGKKNTNLGTVYPYRFLQRCREKYGTDAKREQERTIEMACLPSGVSPNQPVLFAFEGEGDKLNENEFVYLATEPQAIYIDYNPIPGKLIGVLKKQGRRFVVKSFTDEFLDQLTMVENYGRAVGIDCLFEEESAGEFGCFPLNAARMAYRHFMANFYREKISFRGRCSKEMSDALIHAMDVFDEFKKMSNADVNN